MVNYISIFLENWAGEKTRTWKAKFHGLNDRIKKKKVAV